jgi:hypothetical protein
MQLASAAFTAASVLLVITADSTLPPMLPHASTWLQVNGECDGFAQPMQNL